jgi:hypothetical protein
LKVLLATDPKAAGQAKLTFTLDRPPLVYVQALSDTGTATLTFSAPSYASQTSTVNLFPSAFAFDRATQNTTKSSPFSFTFSVLPVLPQGGLSYTSYTLRSGVSVVVVSSQPSVGSVKPAPLTSATGTTILTITPPAGFGSTNPPSQMVVTVN